MTILSIDPALTVEGGNPVRNLRCWAQCPNPEHAPVRCILGKLEHRQPMGCVRCRLEDSSQRRRAGSSEDLPLRDQALAMVREGRSVEEIAGRLELDAGELRQLLRG